jgi:predicted MFS family arabinose efflux permease
MLPELTDAFQVSTAALGNLSACYFYAYALAQIPVGLILDRYSTRTVLTKACLMLALASLIFAVTNNFVVAEICRIFIGLGSAFAFVGCLKIGSNWFQGKQFGFILGLTNLLGITGAILGGKPSALAIDMFGWRFVMFSSAVAGLVITVALWTVVKDKQQSNHNPKLEKILQHLFRVLKCKQIWLIALFGAFMVAPIGTYSELWGVSFLINHYKLDRPTAAQISTLAFFGIACGGPIIGWISDRIHRSKLPMLYGATIAGISMALILSGINFTSATITLVFLGSLHFAFGFFTSSMLLSFSLATSACKADARATTIAFVNTIIMVMVALLQSLSGFLLEISNADFILGFMPIILCYLFAFICYNYIRET